MAAYPKPPCVKERLMQRICFVLQVKPERLAEYKERHRHVWPEMRAALRETGWGNYSLFLRDDGLLVGYLETPDFAAALRGMAGREINERLTLNLSPACGAPVKTRINTGSAGPTDSTR